MNRFITLLVLLLIGLLVLGYYRGWFSFIVHRPQMQKDIERAKERVRELGSEAKEEARELGSKVRETADELTRPAQTVQGTIRRAEMGDNRFILTTAGNKDMTFELDAASHIRINGKEGKLENLRAEDEAKVTFHVRDGKNSATSVTVNRERCLLRCRKAGAVRQNRGLAFWLERAPFSITADLIPLPLPSAHRAGQAGPSSPRKPAGSA